MVTDPPATSDTSTSVEIVPFFGGFILETLTVGMYGESRNAIREYIQNGFDSIQQAIKRKVLKGGEGLIEIELSGDKTSLTIRDNGAGLPESSAVKTLTAIGSSTKDYRKNAGFRGIGRLAGIVFSETVRFTTKASGEANQTEIVFNAHGMRKAMSPGQGSEISADSLIRQYVSGTQTTNPDLDKHFFEVKLEGLTDPPEECVSFHSLKNFVSEVAPVPYSPLFKLRAALAAAEKEHKVSIDEVRVSIKEGDKDPVDVVKPYRDKHKIDDREVPLDECDIISSASGKWWGWVGKKGTESGAFDEESVRGLRVRVKNIQIDGTQIIRDTFLKQNKSYPRFTEYFLGEIFVDPSWLVPNARRDGFEEDPNWKTMRTELGAEAKKLGRKAYDASTDAQRTVGKLGERLKQAREELDVLRRTAFADVDRAMKLSVEINSWKRDVEKATIGADRSVAAELNEIGANLADIKAECLKKIGVPEKPDVDVEAISLRAREELVQELIVVFEDGLSPACMNAVRTILRAYLDQPDL